MCRSYSHLYLHEVAVEEGSLGEDEVGTDAASYSLLDSHKLLLGQVNAWMETIKVTPAQKKKPTESKHDKYFLQSDQKQTFYSFKPEVIIWEKSVN